jgi:hypothetical protein
MAWSEVGFALLCSMSIFGWGRDRKIQFDLPWRVGAME